MANRDGLRSMDFDTHWAYDDKVRKLQQAEPERWPIYWAAYLALVGEAWTKRSRRVTLEESWCPAVPCSAEDAARALSAVRLIDSAHRIASRTWKVWFGPAAARIQRATKAAETRWNKHAPSNAQALPKQSSGNAMSRTVPSRTDTHSARDVDDEGPERSIPEPIVHLLEELTGRPAFINPYGRTGERLWFDLRDFGEKPVETAMRRVPKTHDVEALVLAAHRLLAPIPDVRPAKPVDQDEAQGAAELAAIVARRQREAARAG
jgi:hypothetical protein